MKSLSFIPMTIYIIEIIKTIYFINFSILPQAGDRSEKTWEVKSVSDHILSFIALISSIFILIVLKRAEINT